MWGESFGVDHPWTNWWNLSIRSNKCCSVLWNKEWQLISLQCQTVSNRKGWLFSFLRSGGLQAFVMAWIQNFCGGKNTIVHSKHGLFGRKLGEFLRLDLQLQPWRFGNYMKLPKRKGFLVGKKHSASEIRTDRPEKPREPGLQPSTLISLWSMRTGLEDTTRRLSFVLGFVCGKTYQKSGATMRKSLFFGGAELRSGRDFFFAVSSRFWWWCFFQTIFQGFSHMSLFWGGVKQLTITANGVLVWVAWVFSV